MDHEERDSCNSRSSAPLSEVCIGQLDQPGMHFVGADSSAKTIYIDSRTGDGFRGRVRSHRTSFFRAVDNSVFPDFHRTLPAFDVALAGASHAELFSGHVLRDGRTGCGRRTVKDIHRRDQ
ncbi:hypothetical protein ALQ43_200135 [Pseudomonas savastanoi pv. glycinea]|nr:hypothetical protein ALQ43_200135 [Pseudomonas savastanoi pv. glycinea]